jgi:hypothetical protein
VSKELNGRELNFAIAERVMGEPMPPAISEDECLLDVLRAEPSKNGTWLHVHNFENGDICEWEPLQFSESIEASMRVVEKMVEDDFDPEMIGHNGWFVVFKRTHAPEPRQWAATLPHAICLAALAAIETKQENE